MLTPSSPPHTKPVFPLVSPEHQASVPPLPVSHSPEIDLVLLTEDSLVLAGQVGHAQVLLHVGGRGMQHSMVTTVSKSLYVIGAWHLYYDL